MTKTVLILGANGKIGSHSAQAFANAGWQVRRFNRATDDMTQAAMGCDAIVNGLNPPAYHDWANLIPQITAQVIAAAKASGAMVVIPGNVYHFGNTPGEWSELTTPTPCSRKGAIRLQMERIYRDSGVQTLVLRAGDFIDPARDGDVMSLLLMRSVAKGQLTAPGDPNAMHTYCYLPDWARAMVSLVDMRDQLKSFEDVPFPGHAFTLTQLRDCLTDALGRPIRISGFPWWLFTLASPVWELARELREMRYLWDTPHTLSGVKFTRLLPGFDATPLRDVMLAGLAPDIHPDHVMAAA